MEGKVVVEPRAGQLDEVGDVGRGVIVEEPDRQGALVGLDQGLLGGGYLEDKLVGGLAVPRTRSLISSRPFVSTHRTP